MADRLTELQDTINQQAENFCNAVGVLQQTAQPSYFPDFDRSVRTLPENQILPSGFTVEDTAKTFSRVIVETAQNIDALVESLPTGVCSPEVEAEALKTIEEEQKQYGKQLVEVTNKLESTLAAVQLALSDIAQTQLSTQALEGSVNSYCVVRNSGEPPL